jgi:hypothetical protein
MRKLGCVSVTRNFRLRSLIGSIAGVRSGLLVALALFLLVTLVIVQRGQQLPVSASTSVACAQVIEDHVVNIPYFTESEGMRSTLTLNNNMPEASEVRLTIFNRKGESFTPSAITIPPNGVERVSMKTMTEGATGDFNSGSIQVFYHGMSMAVTCQVSVTSER